MGTSPGGGRPRHSPVLLKPQAAAGLMPELGAAACLGTNSPAWHSGCSHLLTSGALRDRALKCGAEARIPDTVYLTRRRQEGTGQRRGALRDRRCEQESEP